MIEFINCYNENIKEFTMIPSDNSGDPLYVCDPEIKLIDLRPNRIFDKVS